MTTIFALSSGALPAALAVVRISGPAALAAACALAGGLPPPRRAGLRALRAANGALLDRALVLVFPAPRSATGEDLVELHLHGGRAVVAAVLAALAAQPALRAAEPGEFTRRALLNGRIDYAQAEGLADLLSAETEWQRRAAIAASEGAVSRLVGAWSATLLMLSAQLEAVLDFGDEDEVGEALPAHLAIDIARLCAAMESVLATPSVTRLRDGVHVVLAGAPNSGKSTLLNALAERDAAIVSPIAGTTRDRIDVPVARAGIPYVLTDTAGLAGATEDAIEAIGITRATAAIASADVLLWLDDAPPPRADGLWVYPRADARPPAPPDRLAVSAARGGGLDRLWDAIAARAEALIPRPDQHALTDRQQGLVRACVEALSRAIAQPDPVLLAEELRAARAALDAITGHSDTEAMLDALFGRFCIGK